MWMRGGTSKGAYFLAEDLPDDPAERDRLLLGVVGSPDPRQIDGIGGGTPLTSKVAVVSRSRRPDADVDYLFLQVSVDRPIVSDRQNCGNILAGVAPFAIERGLVAGRDGETEVVVHMVNSGALATAVVRTPGGRPTYRGEARIAGVPGTHAPVLLFFHDTAGSTCGALLPTGRAVDVLEGVPCTLIDNGMPVVVLPADALGIAGDEPPAALEADTGLRTRLERIRLQAGPLMNLGDVREQPVPKLTLVSPPRADGTVHTRTFVPHRCHEAIGVLGAVSVATACLLPESPAAQRARLPEPDGTGRLVLAIEHPSGVTEVVLELDAAGGVRRAGVLRTARKLMDGFVYPP